MGMINMNTIVNDFTASFDRIRNNFYISFLSINYINLPNLPKEITLDVSIEKNIISRDSLKRLTQDEINEYGNSIRRHFLNDMVIAYERYASTMYTSHINTQLKTDPSTINDRSINSTSFEDLANIYSEDEKLFFTQLRRLRNSIVHFNGVYTVTNEINYTFNTEVYQSVGFEGTPISIGFETLLWIFSKLRQLVSIGNTNYFNNYQ